MDIKKYSTVEGSKKAIGLTVVIDVLRACTTIPILLKNGANTIIPIKKIDEAKLYRDKKYILIGKGRDGHIHDTFHHCNSPSEIELIDFREKNIIIRTNNATQAIHNAINAEEIVLASFVNLDAIVKYILDTNAEQVTLLPIGRLNKKGLEDELCAQAIEAKIKKEPVDIQKIKENVKECTCAILVSDTLGKPRDVDMALKFNSYPIVQKVYNEGGIKIIKSL